jgi:MFS family permease
MTAASMPEGSKAATIIVLGLGQVLGWGSSFYLPAILAAPMARDLDVATPVVFGVFSLALVLSAALGPGAGRLLDRHGGRIVLALTNVIFALGLVALSRAEGLTGLLVAWGVLGLAMGAGLYEAAFATAVQHYRAGARPAITGITLIAGFASTVAWPLSLLLEARYGWRGCCLVWAALHLVLGLPLHLTLRRPRTPGAIMTGTQASGAPAAADAAFSRPSRAPSARTTALLLAYVFAVTWFIATAMATHLPLMLQAAGASIAVAVGVGALVGPAQVAARLLDFGLLKHVSPVTSARVASFAHPLGAMLLLTLGPGAAAAFALLHGAGNGVMTIAKGTLPLVYFGADGYGARQGWLMMPARVAMAAAPVLFGLLLERLGTGAIWVSGGLGLSAFLVLGLLRRP